MSRFQVYRDGRRYYPSYDALSDAIKEAGNQSHPKWKCNPYVKDEDTGAIVFMEGYDYFYNDHPDMALDEARISLLKAQHDRTYPKKKFRILTLSQLLAEAVEIEKNLPPGTIDVVDN